MNFNFETQGSITYLVCELEANEELDTLTLGMLTNNHINGLAPVLYTEMDGHRFLKYNISAKVTVNQFFSVSMNKQRAITAFQNIINALCSADDYMIDPNCFSANAEQVFLNVSNCEVALICIPVATDKNINTETIALFKQILSSTQFDASDDMTYITQITNYLNSDGFTIYAFKDLIQNIASGKTAPVQSAIPNVPAQPKPVAPPVAAFDSTISIDDMPASMGGNKQPPVENEAPSVNQPQIRPQPQPQIRKPVPVQPAPQVNNQVKPQIQIPSTTPPAPPVVPKPQPPVVNIPKPPVQNNPGFAIPGQPGMANPPQPGVNPPIQNQPQAQQPAQANDKKMSFFNLVMHYNKENAAIYKSQKDADKSKQIKQPKPPKASKNVPVPPSQNAYPPKPGVPPVSGQSNQPTPGSVPQTAYRPPIQPIPVQNSFNETTVLSPIGGETTVLSENPVSNEPYLTRLKTNEKVFINKPIFRIGKEKSYVDFFISDNTAISRSHCNIHVENGEYFIEDTNSTNHTYVNGKIINSNEKVKLSNGDKVRLANEDFTFSI